MIKTEDSSQVFFGAATISEIAMINGNDTAAIIATAADGSFKGKQFNAFGASADSVREIGLWAITNNAKVSLGVNAENQIITFGYFPA